MMPSPSCDSPLASSSPSGPVNWALCSGTTPSYRLKGLTVVPPPSAPPPPPDETPVPHLGEEVEVGPLAVTDLPDLLVTLDGEEATVTTSAAAAAGLPSEAIDAPLLAPPAEEALTAPMTTEAAVSETPVADSLRLPSTSLRQEATMSSLLMIKAALNAVAVPSWAPPMAGVVFGGLLLLLLTAVLLTRRLLFPSCPVESLVVIGTAAPLHPGDQAPYLAAGSTPLSSPLQVRCHEIPT